MTKALIPTELNITSLGQIFAQSGFFSDAKEASKAIVKILAGQELGLPPIASMTGIDIIKGKISLSAVAMATVLKRHGDYDYRVRKHDNNGCEIEFFHKGESLGISSFTIEDAKQAKLFESQPNYKKYPRNMFYARAMSNGIRWYCPEVLGGPTYTPGELEQETEKGSDDGQIRDEERKEATVEGEIVSQQIDDFANSLEIDQEAKTLVNKLIAKEYPGDNTTPKPMKAKTILEDKDFQKAYPNKTQDDIIEMMGD